MSSITSLKRALPPKVAKMKARKKQKLMSVKESSTKDAKMPVNTGKIIKLNDLKWKEVAPPDQMDDYEGFFGLEEIDGVDVVRSDDTGKVSYKITNDSTRDTSKAQGQQRKQGTPRRAPNSNSIPETQANSDAANEEDEWGGLEDSVEVHKAKAQQKEMKNAKMLNNNEKPQDAGLQNAQFNVLEEEEMDTQEEDVDVSGWHSLSLSPYITGALAELKFSNPTPVQLRSIPPILEGRDLIGKAPTGSGKTLAFGIPIIQEWLANKTQQGADKAPIALIVLPTRELAHQISAHLAALCSKGRFEDSLSIATLTGGLSIQKQRRLLNNADIVVGTPGRLWEVVSEGRGVLQSLKRINYLVLDEADRLLTEGHFKELEKLLTALNRKVVNEEEVEGPDEAPEPSHEHQRQTLVFSATFSKNLQQRLSKRNFSASEKQSSQASMEYLLKKVNFRDEKPVFIDVNPVVQMAEKLSEALLECAGPEKDLYLYSLLLLYQESDQISRALVFVNAISAVRRLVPFLSNLNITAHALHSQMPQKARLRSIERFSQDKIAPGGNCSVLVATDVAARGLDIPNVPLVVHYNVPRTADTYVHRSGRTARADKSGTSVLICAPSEAAGLRRLVAQVHSSDSNRGEYHLRSVDLDTRVISRLKQRAAISKKLADAVGAKERKHSEDVWMKAAADELGVDIDEQFDLELGGKKNRKKGTGRKEKEEAARTMTKSEMAALRAQLKDLLSRRINVGVSERYLTSSGSIDLNALLRQKEQNGDGASAVTGGAFLGSLGMKLVS